MSGLAITTVKIYNNPTSVPPLILTLKTTGQTNRGVAVVGMFLVGAGGAGNYTYAATGLPAGLSLNTATGAITGSPTTISHNIITATVTDGATNTYTTTFSINVHANLVVVNGTPPSGEISIAYSYTFTISGATGAVTWALTSGTLPAGLTLSAGGVLSGTPTTVAKYTSTITATDAGSGDTLSVPLSINVAAKLTGNFFSTPTYSLSAGTNYPQLPLAVDVPTGIAALNGVPPYKYTFDTTNATWATGNPNTGFVSGAPPTTPLAQLWSAAGSLTGVRYIHTATLLNSGKALVTGGYNVSALLTCELYDPAANTWSVAGPLTGARYYHTATLLNSGKVLATGGAGPGRLTTCELYDPVANTWSAAGPLTGARQQHTATLLNSGKVLVTGGDNVGALLTCELYDPVANTWSAAGSLTGARRYHTATLLNSGKVLVTGGDNGGALLTCELYDPAANTWSAAGSLTGIRYRHTATLLNSGKVLVSGGYSGAGNLATCELYDPVANTWSAAGSLTGARSNHTITLLNSGKVLVTGGNGGTTLLTCELYDPVANTWSAAGSLTGIRETHTATLLNSGKVLVTGGFTGVGALATCELFYPGIKVTVVDSVGAVAYEYISFQVYIAGGVRQAQINGVNAGADSPPNFNFTGSGVSDIQGGNQVTTVVLAPYVVASGTNTYTGTITPTPNALTTNATYKINFTNGNTSASSLNLSGLGALAIQLNGAALTAGQIPANSTLEVLYDGAAFQIVGGLPGMPAATASVAGYLLAADWTTFNNKQAAVSFAAVGATPNANAGGIAAGVITLQPADGSNPGVITTAAQTIAGAKTFASTIAASNFSGTSSGTNTGDQNLSGYATTSALTTETTARIAGDAVYIGSTSGTNTYTATPSPAISSYVTGKLYSVQFVNANTTAVTLNISGLGSRNVYKNGSALTGAEISANAMIALTDDGTRLNMTGDGGGGGGGGGSTTLASLAALGILSPWR